MRKLLALSIVCAVLLPLTVLADGPKDGKKPEGPRHQPFFLKWDLNKDGVIAKDELPKDDKRAEDFFNRLDKNKDGKVCKKEIGEFFQEMKKRHEERAKQMTKDGKKPDFKKDSKACPYKKDCKKDGKDCPYKKDCKACPNAKKDGHHKHHGHHGQKGPRDHKPFFVKWDLNKDGVISKDELPKDDKRAEGFFNRLDKNKDGKVCKKEIGEFFQEMKKRHETFAKDGKPGPRPDFKGPRPDFKGPRPFPTFDPAKAAEGFFDKADLNKDGNITKDELSKFFAEGQKKFKERMEQMKKDGKKDAKKDCKKDAKKADKK